MKSHADIIKDNWRLFEPGAAEQLHKVPEHLRDGLLRYVVDRIMPGDFLRAVLSNDLMRAFSYATPESRESLRDLVFWIYNYVTSRCWGSEEKVNQWVRAKEVSATC